MTNWRKKTPKFARALPVGGMKPGMWIFTKPKNDEA
jgi:hypothetical protein